MNYYHNYDYYGRGGQFLRPRLLRGAVRNIIIANVAVFLIMFIFQAQRFFSFAFGLVPQWVWSRGYIWQLCSYMFIHAGLGHIFWNMFVLWMFGSEIENYLGKREFYKFYFITGIGSGIITFLFSTGSTIPVVGASGALFGVLVAFALLFPERRIYFYFLIPIKAKYFVIIIGVITFFSTFTPGTSNISHLTHLGGLVIGYLYFRGRNIFRALHINIKNPFKNIIRKIPKDRRRKSDHYDSDATLQEELDRILEKINRNGYDSLSEEEKQQLLLASQYFANKKGRHE